MQILDNVKPLSKKLSDSIPRLKDGEVAIFRLKNAFKEDLSREDESTGKPERTSPEWVQYPGTRTITDPYEVVGTDTKGNSIYKPVTKIIGTSIKDYREMKGSQAKPIYESVVFIKGECRVQSDQVALYEFMMRDTYCETNKYRLQMGGKKITPKYYLVGGKEITPFMQNLDMKFFAEKMVRESSHLQLKEMATMLNKSVDTKIHVKAYQNGFGKIDAIKYELIQIAAKYPKQVMAATPDQKAKLRVQIYDAQVYGVLSYDKGSYLIDSDGKFVEIMKQDADSEKDKIDALIEYLMSDEGRQSYLLLAKTLRSALNISDDVEKSA